MKATPIEAEIERTGNRVPTPRATAGVKAVNTSVLRGSLGFARSSWEPAVQSVDVPFLPGHRVRIRETRAIPYDTNPRRWFRVTIDDADPVSVVWVKYPDRELLICDEHDVAEDCDCKRIAAAFMRSDP